jgi:hypothetical protein
MDTDTRTQKHSKKTELCYSLQSCKTFADDTSNQPTLRSLFHHDEVFLLGASLLLMIILLIG